LVTFQKAILTIILFDSLYRNLWISHQKTNNEKLIETTAFYFNYCVSIQVLMESTYADAPPYKIQRF